MSPSVPNADSTPDASSVEDALESLAAMLRDRHAAALEALRSEGLGPLRDTLDDVAGAHDDARAALDLSDDPDRRVLWAAVRRYRQATLEAVWSPLRSTLDRCALGALLRDRREALQAARAALPDAVPQSVERAEPPALYASIDADGWGRWAAKAAVRTWRAGRGRLWGEQEPWQTVPLRSIVAHHAATTLASAQAEALDTAEQRLVQWAARLERTATRWTHRLLEMERALDHPDFHVEADVAPPEPSDDPTAGVMAVDVEALQEDLHQQADVLHECLVDGRSLALDDVAETLADGTERTVERVRGAADRAGSPFAERSARSSEKETEVEPPDRWSDWFDEVGQRLAFLDALATLRDALTDRHAALVADVAAAGLAPVRAVKRDTTEGLQALRDELDALLEAPAPGAELDLVQAVDHQAETGTDLLEQTLLAPLRELAPRRTMESIVETHRQAVTALVADQPDGFVVHPLVAPDADRVTPTEPYTLQWRTGSEEVLDEVLFDGWETAFGPLIEATDTILARAVEVRGIVQFHLGAALQELQDLRDARKQDRPDAAFVDDARELALGGLDRALDLLASGEELDRAGGHVVHRTWRATTGVWTELHDRVRAAGEARAHVLRLRGATVRGTRWLAAEAGRRLRAASTQVQRTAHRLQRQARRLVRLGHAAVGTEPVDEAALRQTVDVLSTVDTVLADLPLVYRRLFSFRPIQDPDLLVARTADRAAVEHQCDRWQRGLTDALVLTGPAGSGHTSFLNVLRKTTFRTAQRHHVELTERLTSEAAFARKVVQALGLSLDPADGLTLDAVAEHLKGRPRPDRVRVCTIEHLEHVVHRSVGGMSLAARVLNFLSETDPYVLWVATATDAAWQLIEASEPAAARLVTRHALDAFDRAELEELILRRHRRSGLRLVFEAPDAASHPLLARRLRATDDEERRQALLRTEFFDRLYEASGQNVMLALFYWCRAVRVDDDGTTLRVQPLEPIAFGALDALPLPHAFALKALLEHGTLTAGELAEVLSVSPAAGRALLDTLANALVLVPAEGGAGSGALRVASVDAETRYRIRPLLVHPVTRFLRSRNIVH